MWRRVGGTISCATCLLLGCGKSERGASTPGDDSAGASAGGVSTSSGGTGTGNSSGGTGSSAGSSVGTGGEVAMGGRPAAAGSATTAGGQAEAGAPEVGGGPSEGGAASCSGGYHACGCGCCGAEPYPLTCVYPELGQDLASIIAADQARFHDTAGCAQAGCSRGIDYVCCESPPPGAEQATYTTSLVIGDIGRIHLDKMGTVDCSRLTLRQRVPSDPAQPAFPLETPAGWEVEQALRSPCISSMTRPLAIGAIGGISLRVLGNACVVDMHLSLFFGDATTGIDAERFDADALPIDLAVAECH